MLRKISKEKIIFIAVVSNGFCSEFNGNSRAKICFPLKLSSVSSENPHYFWNFCEISAKIIENRNKNIYDDVCSDAKKNVFQKSVSVQKINIYG